MDHNAPLSTLQARLVLSSISEDQMIVIWRCLVGRAALWRPIINKAAKAYRKNTKELDGQMTAAQLMMLADFTRMLVDVMGQVPEPIYLHLKMIGEKAGRPDLYQDLEPNGKPGTILN